MTEPTDAELWQLHMQMPGVHKDPIDFARAVLAKWGTPQPVVRELLTNEQIVEAFCEQPHPVQFVSAFSQGVRFAERHHGIKGGQHGAE